MIKNYRLTQTRLENLCNEDLCIEAQKGDKRAEKLIIKRNYQEILGFGRRWKIPGLERDDLDSIALLASYQAIYLYKKTPGTTFINLINSVIWKNCSNEKRLSGKTRRLRNSSQINYDPTRIEKLEEGNIFEEFEPSAEDIVVEKIHLQQILRQMDTLLHRQSQNNEHAIHVISLLIDGNNPGEISAILNVPTHIIRRIRMAARNKIGDLLGKCN
jgi:hypothetical protein